MHYQFSGTQRVSAKPSVQRPPVYCKPPRYKTSPMLLMTEIQLIAAEPSTVIAPAMAVEEGGRDGKVNAEKSTEIKTLHRHHCNQLHSLKIRCNRR